MRALEFIRDHVTFKLPYDFSYQMKNPNMNSNVRKYDELINSRHCAFRTIRSSWYEYSRTQDCLLADTIALYNSFPSTARITFFRETDVVSALESKLFTWLENPQKFWPQIDASWAFRGIISIKLSYSLTQILSQAEKNNQWLVNFRWN